MNLLRSPAGLGQRRRKRDSRRIDGRPFAICSIPDQEASAFCLSLSNSSWLMAPLSRRAFAEAIWSAGLLLLATDWMY